jgi:hypothetical protein
VAVGNYVLANVGPDEPFGGGIPGVDFVVADPATTGQVMEFRVVPARTVDDSTPPQFLQLPAITPLPAGTVTRPLALFDEMSAFHDGPAEALLGVVSGARMWHEEITENPAVGATEVWEFFNATEDVGLALGPGATETGLDVKTVMLDVSAVQPGTLATLRFLWVWLSFRLTIYRAKLWGTNPPPMNWRLVATATSFVDRERREQSADRLQPRRMASSVAQQSGRHRERNGAPVADVELAARPRPCESAYFLSPAVQFRMTALPIPAAPIGAVIS